MRPGLQTLAAGCVVVVALFLCRPAMSAQPHENHDDTLARTCENLLFQGVEAYGELDYARSETILEQAAFDCLDCPQLSDRIKVAILEQLAVTHIALGKNGKAEERFARLLLLDPAHTLDHERLSPKIITLFNQVRDRMKKAGMLERPQAPAPALVVQAPAPAPAAPEPVAIQLGFLDTLTAPCPYTFETSLSLGATLLFGNDLKTFGGGVTTVATLDYSPLPYLYAGVALRYNGHPTSGAVGGGKLHYLAAQAAVGLQYNGRPLRVRLGLGLGGAGFGLDGVDDRGAVVYGINASLDYPMTDNLLLGLVADFTQVSDTEGRHSGQAGFFGRLGYRW